MLVQTRAYVYMYIMYNTKEIVLYLFIVHNANNFKNRLNVLFAVIYFIFLSWNYSELINPALASIEL